jgi:cullin 4
LCVDGAWSESCEQLLTVRGIFLYLDRTFVIQQPALKSIWDVGLRLFCDQIKVHAELERRITQSLLDCVERERRG